MNKKISLELYWWLFTVIIAFAILFPILNKVSDYPFLIPNVVFIATFITFTRYIFLLKHTFLAQQVNIKVGIVLLSLIIIFYLTSEINTFQTFLDEEGPDTLVQELPNTDKQSMASYIRSEYLFFGIGSVISAIVLPFRLVVSIWRNYNRGTA